MQILVTENTVSEARPQPGGSRKSESTESITQAMIQSKLQRAADPDYNMDAVSKRFTTVSSKPKLTKSKTMRDYLKPSSSSNNLVTFSTLVSSVLTLQPDSAITCSSSDSSLPSFNNKKRKRTSNSLENICNLTNDQISKSVQVNLTTNLSQPTVEKITVSTQTMITNINYFDQFQDDNGQPTVTVRRHVHGIFEDGKQALVDEARSRLRASVYLQMADQNMYPDWALGYDQLPMYIQEIPDSIVPLKKAQAKELMYTLADYLSEESERAGETSLSCIKTLRDAY